MTVLTENIKTHNPFRNRLLAIQVFPQILFPYILLISFGRNSIADAIEGNRFPGILLFYFISMFLLSALVSTTQIDLLTKPFSSCLPNQGKAQRNIQFLTGTAAALFYGLVLFISPHPKGFMGVLYFISYLSIGISLYIIGSFATFNIQRNKKKGSWLFLTLVMVLITGLLLGFFDILPFIVRLDFFLYYFSAPLLALTFFAVTAFYRFMVSHGLARELALKNFSMPIPGNTISTMEQTEKLVIDRLSDRVEEESSLDRLFTKYIGKYSQPGIIKSAGAKLYGIMDRYHTYNKGRTILALPAAFFILSLMPLLTGYRFEFFITNYAAEPILNFFTAIINYTVLMTLMFIFCAMVSSALRPFSHNQLFPEGRRQRFCSTLIPWLIKQSVIAVWIFIIILSGRFLKEIMPVIDFGVPEFQYTAPGISLVLWALFIASVFEVFMFYFKKPCSVFTMIIYLASILALSFCSMLYADTVAGYLSLSMAVLISNGFFIERLAKHILKKDIESFI